MILIVVRRLLLAVNDERMLGSHEDMKLSEKGLNTVIGN